MCQGKSELPNHKQFNKVFNMQRVIKNKLLMLWCFYDVYSRRSMNSLNTKLKTSNQTNSKKHYTICSMPSMSIEDSRHLINKCTKLWLDYSQAIWAWFLLIQTT